MSIYVACFSPEKLGPIRKSPNYNMYVHVEATNKDLFSMDMASGHYKARIGRGIDKIILTTQLLVRPLPANSRVQ